MSKLKPRIVVTIDSNTIFRVLLILLGIVFLYYISDVLVIAFIAFIIVSAIAPVVDFLEKFYLPRSIVTLLIYTVFLGGTIYLLTLLVPAVGEQIRQLAHNMPAYLNKLGYLQEKYQYFIGNRVMFQDQRSELLLNLGNRLSQEGINIFSQAGSFIKGILSFLAILSLSFYLSIQKKTVGSFLRAFIPKEHQEYAVILMDKIQKKMGYWLLGQMMLNIIVGVLVYVGLTLLNVPYALLLAILAAAFEVVPYIGPVLSSIAGILVALSVSPILGIFVLIMYIFIQQLENHLLVPLVMKQAVGLNPVAVIIAMLIGANLAGSLGLILAIPVTAALSVFVSDFIAPEPDVKTKSKELKTTTQMSKL